MYVSKSDILGPIDYLSDIENLVSFERAMFEDYGFKYRIKIFLLFVYITTLKCMPRASWTEYMSNIRAQHFYQYILGLFNKIWYIYIICKEYGHWTTLKGFNDPVKILLNTVIIKWVILTSFY